MNKSNIGVQLFPIILLLASFGYAALGSLIMGGFCFVLALGGWLVLWSEQYKKDK